MSRQILICPVCRETLLSDGRSFRCANGHSFDRSKEGYVNLLCTTKNGDRIGDDKESCRSRRDFLNKGYYSCLRDRLTELIREYTPADGNVLDICCGEGWYTSAMKPYENAEVFGFDISKEMVRLASKRGNAAYFVANITDIPIRTSAVNTATELFAPFYEREFERVLCPDGVLLVVVPAAKHLWGIKSLLYDSPYENDEKLPESDLFTIERTEKVSENITLESSEDINAVFRMTPYFFRTSQKDKDKLIGVDRLETEVSFIIGVYRKKNR